MRWLLGGLIAVVLVAGVTAGVAEVLGIGDDGSTTAVPTTGSGLPTTTGVHIVPAAGQALVSGTVTAVAADDALLNPLRTPLTVTTPERGFGSGATIEGVTVGDDAATIVWDAGQAFVLSGQDGALLLDPVHVDVGALGMVVLLDGPVHGFAPGSYRLDTPVAVGTSGLAQPADGVTFAAGPSSTVTFSGRATAVVPPGPIVLRGPGSVTLTGAMQVETTAGTVAAATVTFGPGPFQVSLVPGPGGYTVTATLQGPVTTA